MYIPCRVILQPVGSHTHLKALAGERPRDVVLVRRVDKVRAAGRVGGYVLPQVRERRSHHQRAGVALSWEQPPAHATCMGAPSPVWDTSIGKALLNGRGQHFIPWPRLQHTWLGQPTTALCTRTHPQNGIGKPPPQQRLGLVSGHSLPAQSPGYMMRPVSQGAPWSWAKTPSCREASQQTQSLGEYIATSKPRSRTTHCNT